MRKKAFRLSADRIRELVPDRGCCFATDHLTVDGKPVGYMYREEPDRSTEYVDSGWRFFSGEETQGYVDDPDNTMIYDVNTIANYDPAIIDYLDLPFGTQLERVPGTNEFQEVKSDTA